MARHSPDSQRPVRPTSTTAKRKGIPLTPLAQQMLHDLQLAGMSDRTQESYLRAVRKFAQWLGKSPDQAAENDLRRYLLFIKNGFTSFNPQPQARPGSTPPRLRLRVKR